MPTPREFTPNELLQRLDSRHDELIRKLDELNTQIEATLSQFAKSRTEDLPAVDVTSSTARISDQSAPGRAA